MTYCEPMYESLQRRLDKKMNLDAIAGEMCPGVEHPRRNVLRLLKFYLGNEYQGFMASNTA